MPSERKRMPTDRGGPVRKVEVGGHEGYIIANVYPDGTLGELFLHGFGKDGSTLDGWTQLAAMLFSALLQYGADFNNLCRKIAHMRFEPNGLTNDEEIPEVASVPDYIVRRLALWFGDEALNEELRQIAEEMGLRT